MIYYTSEEKNIHKDKERNINNIIVSIEQSNFSEFEKIMMLRFIENA